MRVTRLQALGALLAVAVPAARASVFAGGGVRTSPIDVCFVGDAVTSRPDRVAQVQTFLQEFSFAANIVFTGFGQCPAATQAGGKDSYPGTMRVVLPSTSQSGTGKVPTLNQCPMFLENGTYNGKNDGWGSWSNFPNDLTPNRSCLYNLKLGDDPWDGNPYLNHTLHEFGHGLGLAHEHERSDADKAACATVGGGITTGFLTPYDPKSVMHYQFPACGIDGNYGRNGLSDLDKTALHILYPQAARQAEFQGRTVIPVSAQLQLQSWWKMRGANINVVAKNFSWKIDGTQRGTSPDFTYSFANPGTYGLQYSYADFLDRGYSYSGSVRVLSNADFQSLMAAETALL